MTERSEGSYWCGGAAARAERVERVERLYVRTSRSEVRT
jgi:hypothetical protein